MPVETSGYVQAIDSDGLVLAAEDGDLLVQALRRPGDLVSRGDALLLAWASKDGLGQDQAARLGEAFSLGPRRTPTQDVRYGVHQLADTAACPLVRHQRPVRRLELHGLALGRVG